MTLYDELRAVLRALDAASVECALVGALAVAVWGAPRATKDIDILVRREQLAKARDALRAIGFTLEGQPFAFKDGTEMQRVNKVGPQGDLMTVDFILVDKNLEAAWDSRARMRFGDVDVSVISRDALIAMKAQAARPQDVMDIQNLRDIDR